jgi:lysylphosphatidylglycerol synthetase-like protein (DUF2156 family)
MIDISFRTVSLMRSANLQNRKFEYTGMERNSFRHEIKKREREEEMVRVVPS